MKVKELLADPDKWCKYYAARDEKGNPTDAHNSSACQWCLIGALYKCYGDHDKGEHAWKAIVRELGGTSIAFFNDSDATGHKEIMELLERADV